MMPIHFLTAPRGVQRRHGFLRVYDCDQQRTKYMYVSSSCLWPSKLSWICAHCEKQTGQYRWPPHKCVHPIRNIPQKKMRRRDVVHRRERDILESTPQAVAKVYTKKCTPNCVCVRRTSHVIPLFLTTLCFETYVTITHMYSCTNTHIYLHSTTFANSFFRFF